MAPSLKAALLAFAMAGCTTQVSPEKAAESGWDKLEVYARCLERMRFPRGQGAGRKLDLAQGLPRDENIKLFSDGRFAMEIPEVNSADNVILFACKGNYKRRTLEFLELNGASQRPQPGESWSY